MSLKINFNISEFNISGRAIPESVADKILHHHILPMQSVREELDVPMWPSEKSGYRSEAWEKQRGRSGKSQHTFKGKGAVDWTCKNFIQNRQKLIKAIIEHTDYTRMALYDTFIHCDYKETSSGKRQVFSSTDDSRWTFISHAEDYKDPSL